ncbi:MAG TPA: hypothetical protein VK151_16430 [Fluviicola sp.]|nr:hypothetical protein [Fluviicola sp.]
MIKIEKVKSYDGNESQLKDFMDDYYTRVTSDYSPLDSLELCINKKRMYLKKPLGEEKELMEVDLTDDQLELITDLKNQFEKIIKSTPKQLEKLALSLGKPNMFGAVENGKFKSNKFGEALLKTFGYGDYFRSKERKGKWYAKVLNIRSCPYCNSQYTLSMIDSNKSGTLTKFQFDHFFSKTRYPFLSISMFNLIPSCPACNLSKSNADVRIKTHYHPYYNTMAGRSKFVLNYNVDLKSLSMAKVEQLKLTIEFNPKYPSQSKFVEQHDKQYHISAIYQMHDDIARDLLRKAIINNSSYKKDVFKVKGLFSGSDKEYRRYLLGNYTDSSEILNRPLAKFYQDLAEQLKLFK